MTSTVQQIAKILKVNREDLGTRLSCFGSEYKMEQHFHLFHEEEIGQLLAKNIASNRRRARINTGVTD